MGARKKRNDAPTKAGWSDRVVKLGAVALGISAILGLLWTFFPNLRPQPKTDTQQIVFNGKMSQENRTLQSYLTEIGVPEIHAFEQRMYGKKATASQFSSVVQPFPKSEAGRQGIMFYVPVKLTGPSNSKLFMRWALMDEHNNELYSSQKYFRQEITIEFQKADDTTSRIWVPTEGRVGTFYVRAVITDEKNTPITSIDSDKFKLP